MLYKLPTKNALKLFVKHPILIVNYYVCPLPTYKIQIKKILKRDELIN